MSFRSRASALGLILLASALTKAQTARPDSASLRFDVASIKPSHTDSRSGGIRIAPGGERYVASNITLKLMIVVAYRVRADQVTGGPSWLNSEFFDMNAKAERPSSVDEMHVMLQNLLADQFQLRFHRETKEGPIYALVVASEGPKLKTHQAANAGEPWIDQDGHFPQVQWHATFAPMDFFAWRLGMILDRPVVDETKLKGGYDFDLSFTAELPPGIRPDAVLNGEPIDTSGPPIFEALQKQLGLKLERQRGPVETLVIDQAEKPVVN